MGHAVLTKPIVLVNKPQKIISFFGKGGRYMVSMTAVKDPMTFFSYTFPYLFYVLILLFLHQKDH